LVDINCNRPIKDSRRESHEKTNRNKCSI